MLQVWSRGSCCKGDPPRVTPVQTLKEDDHSKGSPLSYAWLKIREYDALILFGPRSTHDFISTNLATKLGIHDLYYLCLSSCIAFILSFVFISQEKVHVEKEVSFLI